jgi:general secretion pathway protein G
LSEREILKCARHPARPAVARCVVCGEPLCEECARLADGRYYCARDVPPPEEQPSRVKAHGGRLRPGLLLALAAGVAAAWGVLALLRPAMEWGAAYYQRELTRARLEDVADAADDFKRDVGRYPTSQEGLAALVKEPPGGGGWLGPYLPESYVVDGAVVDATGKPLAYEVSTNEHAVVAAGKDGKLGTADDWKLRFEGRARKESRAAFPSLWGALKEGSRRGGS